MDFLGYEGEVSIGFGCNSLDAWQFSRLNASVEIVAQPYDNTQQLPQETSLPSAMEFNTWFPESLLNLSSSEINNDRLLDPVDLQSNLYSISPFPRILFFFFYCDLLLLHHTNF